MSKHQTHLSVTEAVSYILFLHPEGVTITEIARHPAWDDMTGSWTPRGPVAQWLSSGRPAPSTISRALQRTDPPIAIGVGAADELVDRRYWKPTEEAMKIAAEVERTLPAES